jgi:hypothetical protein
MQDLEYELPRITLLGNRVNKLVGAYLFPLYAALSRPDTIPNAPNGIAYAKGLLNTSAAGIFRGKRLIGTLYKGLRRTTISCRLFMPLGM